MQQPSANKYAVPTVVVYNAKYNWNVFSFFFFFLGGGAMAHNFWGLICGFGGLAPKPTPVHASDMSIDRLPTHNDDWSAKLQKMEEKMNW